MENNFASGIDTVSLMCNEKQQGPSTRNVTRIPLQD